MRSRVGSPQAMSDATQAQTQRHIGDERWATWSGSTPYERADGSPPNTSHFSLHHRDPEKKTQTKTTPPMQWECLRPNVATTWPQCCPNVAPLLPQGGPMWPNVAPMLPQCCPYGTPRLPLRGGSLHFVGRPQRKFQKLSKNTKKMESSMQWECLRPSVAITWSNVAPMLPHCCPIVAPFLPQCCPDAGPLLLQCGPLLPTMSPVWP